MRDLSIIIPVYNTPESALRKCFDSVKALRGIRWEALIVNDGSREETGDFCRQYCAENEGFVYLSKENGGVSSARNMGLEQAGGSYVMFVDADDVLLPDALTPAQLASDADLVIFDTDMEQNGVRVTWESLELPAGNVDRTQVLRRYITSHVLNGPYAKLYKTALLQSSRLRFDESFVTGEDWLFGCSFALLAETVVYVPEPCYLYYCDGGNALSRLNRFPDRMSDNVIAMYQRKLQILEEALSSQPDVEQLRSAASAAAVENFFNCAADLYLLKKLTPARAQKLLQVCAQAQTYLLPSAPKKARMKAWLLTHFRAALYPVAHLRAFYLSHKR